MNKFNWKIYLRWKWKKKKLEKNGLHMSKTLCRVLGHLKCNLCSVGEIVNPFYKLSEIHKESFLRYQS